MSKEGLKNELRLKIDECEMLHSELEKRPIVVDVSCDLVSYEHHKKNEELILQKISNGDEFYLNAKKDNGVLTLRPFKHDDGLFYGLVVGSNVDSVNVFEIARFGSYDTYQSKDTMITNFSNN